MEEGIGKRKKSVISDTIYPHNAERAVIYYYIF
jgi:hypothetical protein